MRLEEIRETMLEIADILNKFPECLQEKAFDVMVHQLFNVAPIAELSGREEVGKEIIAEMPTEESVKEKDKYKRYISNK